MSSEVQLPHLTAAGDAHMVDVSEKTVSNRVAVAEAWITMSDETRVALFGGKLAQGRCTRYPFVWPRSWPRSGPRI